VIPSLLDVGDISESSEPEVIMDAASKAAAKEELDKAIPFHSLLDVSANKSRAELAHKGLLSSRHRPSQEALRAAMMRKSISHTSSTASFQTVSGHCSVFFLLLIIFLAWLLEAFFCVLSEA